MRKRRFPKTCCFCFVALVAMSSPPPATAQQRPNASLEPVLETRMVDVDGYAMRVATAGLEARQPDEPVVVFENGAVSPLEAWGDVPARVARFAPVLAYDRSTVGRSEWDGELGTPPHVTTKLWALLGELAVDPPYVLVGWSWGGDLIRYHAGSHPEDVAGLVHVDPAGHSSAAALSVLRAIGLGEAAYAADVAAMEGALPTIPPAAQADVKVINQLYADRAEPEYGPVPPVPTAVLLSGRRPPLSDEEIEAFGEPRYDRQVHYEARLRDKIRRLSEWALAPPGGLFVVARNSGHAIQTDEPELVVDAIRRVVFPGASNERVAFHDVTVVDVVEGSLRRAQTVLIEGNRIAAMGPSGEVVVEDGTRLVDGAGGYLIPGLWDMHAHALGSMKAFAPMLEALVANGVTGIRDPQHSSLELAAMIEPALRAGVIPGPPRLIVGGNLVDGPPPAWPGAQVADSPERGRAIVDSLVAAGAPFIKVYDHLAPETYVAIVERAKELGVQVVGHVPLRVSAAEASAAGQDSFEHLLSVMQDCSAGAEGARTELNRWLTLAEEADSALSSREAFGRARAGIIGSPFDENRCRALLSELAENRTWQVPTLLPAWALANVTDSTLTADPRTRYVPRDGVLSYWRQGLGRMPPRDRATRMFDRQMKIAGMLEEHGVPLLVGTDMPAMPMVYPGFGVHDEMKLLADAGMSPLYILQAATLNPARFLAMDDSLGTVEVGKLADLVLLDENPLEDIANTQRIRAVMANGRLYERPELDSLLDQVAAKSARRSIATILRPTLDEDGLDAARETYVSLRSTARDSVSFSVWDLGELGHELLSEGRRDEARTIFEWSIESHPESPYAHALYAYGLDRMGRTAEAAEQWTRAAEIAERTGHPGLDHFRAQARRDGALVGRSEAGQTAPDAACIRRLPEIRCANEPRGKRVP